MKRLIPVALAVSVLTAGCATKEYVNTTVNTQVSGLNTTLSARGDGIENLAKDALNRANAAHKLAEGKFVFASTLRDEATRFESARADLSPEAEARLAQISDQLIGENRNVYIEIQGHTDSTGSPAINQNLGLQRAEAVRLFLNKRGVPLNRMSSISYRDTTPVAPNDTPESRAANRRVVLIVMN